MQYILWLIKRFQKANRDVDLIHLDNDGFSPVMMQDDLKVFVAHQSIDPQVFNYNDRVKNADHLIFIFPVWWDMMPATTKGFIDRVLIPGVECDHHPRGFGLVTLLKNLRSMTINTTMKKPRILFSLHIGNLIGKEVFLNYGIQSS